MTPLCSAIRGPGLALLLAAALPLPAVRAQAPALLWSTNIGATAFAVDEQTNVYAHSSGTVIQLNASGVPLQTNLISPLANVAQRDSAGNLYFAGTRSTFHNGTSYIYTNPACFLAKYTAAGTLVWSNGFGPTGAIRGVAPDDLRLDENGMIYVAYTYHASTIDHHPHVAKFDTAGSNVWTAGLPKSSWVTAAGTARLGEVSTTNGFAVTYVSVFPNWHVMASRFDSDGIVTFLTFWISGGLTESLAMTSSQNYYGTDGGYLKQFGPTGTTNWAQNTGSSQTPIGPDAYDGVHLADSAAHLSRYDSDGNLVWTINLPASGRKMIVDPQGNRFLTMGSAAPGNGIVGRLGPETISAPVITNAPQTVTVLSGSNAVLSVGASGFTPLRYYWQFEGNPIAGKTNATLSFTPAVSSNAGSYSVIVSNIAGSVTSAPVLLRVKSVAIYHGGQILTNGTYTFLSPTNLTIRSAFAGGSTFYTLDGSAPSFASTFYNGPFTLSQSATVRALGYSADFSQSEEADAANIIILVPYTLTVLPSSGGSVSLNPPGGPYFETNMVTATAVPADGWSFLHWLGDASGTSTSVNIHLNRNKTIKPVFGTTLSTTVAGNGQVLLDPPGGLYAYGTVVRLTGVPQSGSYFGFWGNAGSGNVNPLYFTIVSPTQTVSSIFGSVGGGQAALTLQINGCGQAAASPQANVYSLNDAITLTATPDPGQTFLNWSGDAGGTQNPLPVIMDQSKVITANFTASPTLSATRPGLEGMSADGFRFTVIGSPFIYEILGSSNLNTWSTLGLVTNDFGEVQFLDGSAGSVPTRFYRAAAAP